MALCCWAHHSLTDALQRQPVICDLAVQAALGDWMIGHITSGAHCCIGVAMRVLQTFTALLMKALSLPLLHQGAVQFLQQGELTGKACSLPDLASAPGSLRLMLESAARCCMLRSEGIVCVACCGCIINSWLFQV